MPKKIKNNKKSPKISKKQQKKKDIKKRREKNINKYEYLKIDEEGNLIKTLNKEIYKAKDDETAAKKVWRQHREEKNIYLKNIISKEIFVHDTSKFAALGSNGKKFSQKKNNYRNSY